MTAPFVVLGDVMVDVVATAAGPLARASDTPATVSFAGGGSAANTAAWLVHAGARALLIGRVGDDAAGRAQIAALQRAGVEARLAIDPWQPTGTCVVVVEPDGERTMLPDRGANLELSPDDLPDAAFTSGGHLHVSGYALLDAGPRAAALAALQRARDSQMTTSVDPSSTAPLLALGPREFLALVAGADLLLPNDDEARVLTGIDDPAAAALALAQQTGSEVVVTAGVRAIHSDGSGVLEVAAPALVQIDTTGAGDAFGAGLLAARGRGEPPERALAAGHTTARAAIRRIGRASCRERVYGLV